jgi:hypothetical protein
VTRGERRGGGWTETETEEEDGQRVRDGMAGTDGQRSPSYRVRVVWAGPGWAGSCGGDSTGPCYGPCQALGLLRHAMKVIDHG